MPRSTSRSTSRSPGYTPRTRSTTSGYRPPTSTSRTSQPRSAATSRTTGRSDAAAGRYRSGNTDSGNRNSITRTTRTPRDSTPTIRKPNNSNTNRRTTTRTTTRTPSTRGRTSTDARRTGATNRYTPKPTPTDWRNARHIRDITTRQPNRTTTKPGSRASNRYSPRDSVARSPRSTGRSDARIKQPRSGVRSDARSTGSRKNPSRTNSPRRPSAGAGRTPARTAATTPIVTPADAGIAVAPAATPNLVPRLAAPRLATPRISPRSARIGNRGFGYRGFGNRGFGNRRFGSFGYRNSLFAGYWGYGNFNNCYGFSNWNYGYGGLSYWGNDPFYWNIGTCSPYAAFRLNYWNSCYWNCYWTGWPIRGALPSNYWWYPSTTYCPTYLYVPSSIYYEEDLGGGGGGDDGGYYYPVEEARAEDVPGGASRIDDTKSSPESLAKGYVELGDFYFKSNRFDVAAEAYAKARNHVPEDASVHFVLADAVFANGDYHYAAFLIAEAVRLEPGIVTADVDKRVYYGDPKTFDAQLAALQKYCDDKPYDAWAQLVLGYNTRFSDQPARAVAAFRRVLELDRDNPTARAFLADLVPALKTGGEGKPAEKSAAAKGAAKPGVTPKIK